MSAKFTVERSLECPEALLGDTELEPVDISGEGHVIAEREQTALTMASESFPEALTVRVHSSEGFGTFLFHEAEIYRDIDGRLVAEHICHQPKNIGKVLGAWPHPFEQSKIRPRFFLTLGRRCRP